MALPPSAITSAVNATIMADDGRRSRMEPLFLDAMDGGVQPVNIRPWRVSCVAWYLAATKCRAGCKANWLRSQLPQEPQSAGESPYTRRPVGGACEGLWRSVAGQIQGIPTRLPKRTRGSAVLRAQLASLMSSRGVDSQMVQTYAGIATNGTRRMNPKRSAEQERLHDSEADSVMSRVEESRPDEAALPVDETFGKYPYDRFREAAEGRVSAGDYARDVLRHVGLDPR